MRTYVFYHNADFDGAICAKLGGGGHTHAAGFRVKEIPFTLIEE